MTAAGRLLLLPLVLMGLPGTFLAHSHLPGDDDNDDIDDEDDDATSYLCLWGYRAHSWPPRIFLLGEHDDDHIEDEDDDDEADVD